MLGIALAALGSVMGTTGAPPPISIYDNMPAACENVVQLPKPTGPYEVGASTFFFVDESREEAGSPDPHDRRQVVFQVWYPASPQPGLATVAYMPELQSFQAGFQTDDRDAPRAIGASLGRYGCVRTASYPNAAAAEAGGKFPIIVFSPGGAMSRHWHTTQAQDLASHGFAVAVLAHAYSTMDVFPNGGLIMTPNRWNPADPESDNALADELAADASFALSRLEEIDAGSITHELSQRLDFARVALIGHSRGGKAVARGCATDPRFSACVTYDNIAPAREEETGIDTPQLTIHAPWGAERTDTLRRYLSLNRAFAAEAILENAGHFSFSDLPIVDPTHYPSDGDPTVLLRRANDVTRAFLDAVWRNDAGSLRAELARAGVEVHVFDAD